MGSINGLIEWQAKLAGLRLVASKPADEAEMNSLFFELSEVAEREVSSEDIADFLASCCRAFSEKAGEAALRGLFYTWFDEMSGTLRCCFSTVVTPHLLPFSGQLRLIDSLHDLAQSALGSGYIEGVPFSELDEDDDWDEDDDDEDFTLDVWVTQIPGDCRPLRAQQQPVE